METENMTPPPLPATPWPLRGTMLTLFFIFFDLLLPFYLLPIVFFVLFCSTSVLPHLPPPNPATAQTEFPATWAPTPPTYRPTWATTHKPTHAPLATPMPRGYFRPELRLPSPPAKRLVPVRARPAASPPKPHLTPLLEFTPLTLIGDDFWGNLGRAYA